MISSPILLVVSARTVKVLVLQQVLLGRTIRLVARRGVKSVHASKCIIYVRGRSVTLLQVPLQELRRSCKSTKMGLNNRLHTYLKQSLPSRRRDRSSNGLDADLQGYEYSTFTTLGSGATKSKNLFKSEDYRRNTTESGTTHNLSQKIHQGNEDLSNEYPVENHVQFSTPQTNLCHKFNPENASNEEGLQVQDQVKGSSSAFLASSRHDSVVSDNSSTTSTPIFASWPDQWRQSMRESTVFSDDASCYSADEEFEDIDLGSPTAYAALSGWGNSPELAQKLRMSVARRSQYVDVGLKSELRESVSSVM